MSDTKNLITALLEYAAKQGADLHICPKSAPFARFGGKNGKLEPVPDFKDSVLDLTAVKAIIGELLTPEQKNDLLKNKYADISYAHGEFGRFRVSVYTQRGTHAVTIHSLPFDVPDLNKIGLRDDVVCELESISAKNKGLIIIAGDYFSHKSVTLAALVDSINQKRICHIATVENPIMYLHRHKRAVVTQKEIGIDVSDFKTALRQIRQENPDVVALSELQQNNFLSVMELAEERLVLASLRTGHLFSASWVLQAMTEIAYSEADKSGQSPALLPNPQVTVIYQNKRGADLQIEIQAGDIFSDKGSGDG